MKSEFAIPVVGALLLDRNDRVFLMQSSGKFGDEWIVPGGKVSFGESLSEALAREIREETGLKISAPALLGVREYIQPERHFIFFEHTARVEQSTDVVLNYEASAHGWFTLVEAKALKLAAPTRELIDERLEAAIKNY